MTKIAYRSKNIETLREWIERGEEAHMTTRYCPRRVEEMAGGSLYWIIDHALVARTPLLGFEQREDGRWTIRLAPRLVPVEPRARRAHQGWRYLADEDAPRDLAPGEVAGDAMPGRLLRKLAQLGLV